jgi:hypothetical protein
MTQVIIQPSYGNPAARKHWKETLAKEIPFSKAPYSQVLTPDDRHRLLKLHPSGSVRFWGATSAQDKQMERIRQGDVVLFAGQKLVRGIGEVGCKLRNRKLSDLMWTQDDKNGSFVNIYSLLNFQPTQIPYETIWELDGFNAGDNFMGLRIVKDERVDDLLNLFSITTTTDALAEQETEERVADALESGTTIADPEAMHKTSTSYSRSETTVFVSRAESLLMQEFRRQRLDGEVKRIKVDVGWTDLNIITSLGHDIVEAKSSSSHDKVRQAAGQLLDYAVHSTEPVHRLTALFPTRPADRDVEYLHWLGIDCLYRVGSEQFHRDEAPELRRAYMRPVWERHT